MHVQPVQAQH